jgi:methylated-DNA-[protein]-cysteine S-methyltransferase
MKTAGTFATPFGPAVAVLDENGVLCEFSFSQPLTESEDLAHDDAAIREIARQVREYCEGERRIFEMDVAPAGTPFQRSVWQELVRIPYGETISYAELARRIGRPAGASRAVGQANGANPIALIIPCHRVIGTDGTLTGYGGGLPLKQALLDFERRASGFAEPQLALTFDD